MCSFELSVVLVKVLFHHIFQLLFPLRGFRAFKLHVRRYLALNLVEGIQQPARKVLLECSEYSSITHLLQAFVYEPAIV